MQMINRKVRVTIEKEIEIEMKPGVFDDMTQEEYLDEFRRGLWHVDGIDDVVKYAACMAATNGSGYEHDGIGLLGYSTTTHPRIPDVKFEILFEDCEAEFIND